MQEIPSDEIRQDIEDTEREIAQMKREVEGLALIGDRMSMFRRASRLTGIQERKIFIQKLQNILAERGEIQPQTLDTQGTKDEE